MKTKSIAAILAVLLELHAQAQMPPKNPFLVKSPFPAVHNGSYRQGNTLMPGPKGSDTISLGTAKTPRNKVSPWLLFSEAYPDGSHTFWGITSTHVFKGVSTLSEFQVVSSYRIDFNPLINDLSWSMLMLPGHQVLTYDDNRLLLFGEKDSKNPKSEIVLIKEHKVPGIKTVSKLCRLYDGNIAFASQDGTLGILRFSDFALLATYKVPLERGEIAYHNDYAVDEKGNFFLSTSRKMISLKWDGRGINPAWSVAMEFGGNKFQGIGTTPTLLGSGSGDRLVCVVDSNSPANLLTFWRDTIPSDWKGLPERDRRIAAISPVPGFSPPNRMNAAVENSPTAYGYGIAFAQYNGFMGQPENTRKGVVKFSWNQDSNRMIQSWKRDDINMNNVLLYSASSDSLYGSGREPDGAYYYYILNWKTGATTGKFPLGNDETYDDPGNANVIGPNREILFSSKKAVIRLLPK